MPKPLQRKRIITTGFVILILLSSCRMRTGFAQQVPSIPEDVTTATDAPAEPVVIPTKAATATAVPTQVPASPTPVATVSITAVKGNLFIRRGPDLAFNSIGVLMEGQKVDAQARDILSDWAQVTLPGHADQTGWVSLQTKYSSVDGDVSSLPVIKPEVWPVPSYLRNCTDHQMLVKPGDILLPSRLEAPENEVWVYPGVYTVYDLDHPDQPDVAEVQLREGLEIDIQVNGYGEKHKCP